MGGLQKNRLDERSPPAVVAQDHFAVVADIGAQREGGYGCVVHGRQDGIQLAVGRQYCGQYEQRETGAENRDPLAPHAFGQVVERAKDECPEIEHHSKALADSEPLVLRQRGAAGFLDQIETDAPQLGDVFRQIARPARDGRSARRAIGFIRGVSGTALLASGHDGSVRWLASSHHVSRSLFQF